MRRLITHCGDRSNYTVHYSLLRDYLRWGMKLKRVISGVSYHQKAWIKRG